MTTRGVTPGERVAAAGIEFFSRLTAFILPSVTEETVSAEIAKLHDTTEGGAHIILVAPWVNAVGPIGGIARRVVNLELRKAVANGDRKTVADATRFLPLTGEGGMIRRKLLGKAEPKERAVLLRFLIGQVSQIKGIKRELEIVKRLGDSLAEIVR